MRLGIDFGSSYTDAVLMRKEILEDTISFERGKRLDFILYELASKKIDKIVVTGAYSKEYGNMVNNIPIKKVDEIKSIGLGGLFVARKKEALVVSIGSGTAMVSCNKSIKHIGGTAIGGRTLTGLYSIIVHKASFEEIENVAKRGKLEDIDLNLKDIYPEGIGLLPPTATAAHFGKLKNYNENDVALALVNMIAQTIGTLAVLGAKAYGHKNIILTGRLATMDLFEKIIKERINNLSDIPVIIPKDAEYATAIGAVIADSIGL
ncbi:MAG: hypothetical protein ABIJ08_05080 [Nanoarchaeota archaeon]